MPPEPTTSAEPVAARRPRWPWWLAGVGVVLLGGWLALYVGLDPWLRRQLEKRVAEASNHRYGLRVGALRTRLADRSVTLTAVRLRSADSATQADVPQVRVSGVALGALWGLLWHPQQVLLDSLTLYRPQLRLAALPTGGGSPLHMLLPPRVAGVQLGYLRVQHAQLTVGPAAAPTVAIRRVDLAAHEVLLSAAGALDTQRLAYARRIRGHLRGGQLTRAGRRFVVRAADLDSKRGAAQFAGLRVEPATGAPDSSRFAIQAGRLTGWRAPALVQRRWLQADSLTLTGVRADVALGHATDVMAPIHARLAPYLKRLELATLRLAAPAVQVRHTRYPASVRDVDLRVTQLRIDSVAAHDSARVAYAAAWALRTGAATATDVAKFYRLQYAALALDTRAGTLRCTDARGTPKLNLQALSQRKGHKTPHIVAHVPRADLTGVDFGALWHRGAAIARTLALTNGRLRISKDARYPVRTSESVLTPETIGQLGFPLDLRELRLVNGGLVFYYYGPKSPYRATATLTRVNGVISNISNDPRRMSARTPAVIRGTGWLQDQCKAALTAWLPLRDPRGRHRLHLVFGPGPYRILNSIGGPARLFEFKNGQQHALTVDMTGDRAGIRGTMRTRYSGMHVQLLTPDLDQNLLTKLKSKAVNGLVLHDNNPDKSGAALRVGVINATRDRRRSVFNLWKRGLVMGLFNSFGAPEKVARKLSEQQVEPGE